LLSALERRGGDKAAGIGNVTSARFAHPGPRNASAAVAINLLAGVIKQVVCADPDL
jgi:hypothetical protein